MKTNLKWSILWMIKCSFFVLIFNTESIGQKYADSLIIELNKLNQLPQTTKRDSIYTDIFIEFLSQSSNITNKSIQILKIKERIKHSKWKLAFGVSELVKGLYSLRSNQQKLAFYHYEIAYNFFRINDAKKLRLYTANRIIYVNMQELAFSGKIDPILNKNCLNYLVETRNNIDSTSDIMYKVNVELNTAYYYLVNKNYKIAYNHYKNYGNLVKQNKEKYYYHYYNAIWAQNLCLLYMDKEKEGLKNINYLKNVFEVPRTDGVHKLLQVMIATFLGKYNIENNNYQIAIDDINKVYNDSILIKNGHFKPVLDQNLYLAYKGLGDSKNALYYNELFVKFKIENDIKTLNEQFTILQIKNKSVENQAKIEQLENNKLMQENKTNQLIRNVLIFGLLLGLGFLFYNYRKNLQLQSKNQELSLKNAEIEQALFKGQTIERKRVAEELHDNLSAKISGIRWRLEAITPHFEAEKEQKIYDSSVNALAEVYTDVRLIAHNLLPAELETKGLVFALEHLIKELNGLNKTQFSLQIPNDLGRFKNKIEYEIFSIILELSNNILKHSQAQNATISLEKVNQRLTLTVADNGVGFGKNKDKKGMGMDNLKSRVLTLNGTLKIENNEGVRVGIEVPV